MRHIKTHPALIDRESNWGEVEATIDLDPERSPRTTLWRLMLAARREFSAAEERFLDDAELDREVAAQHGGASVGSEG